MPWQNDNNCWICNKSFNSISHSVLIRKHQCQDCSHSICQNCSKQIPLGHTCRICFIPNGMSREKQVKLTIAKEAIHVVNNIILRSFTKHTVELQKIDRNLYPSTQNRTLRLQGHHAIYMDEKYVPSSDEYYEIEHFLLDTVKHSCKFNVGNCLEYALLVFYYLRKKMQEGKIIKSKLSIARIENGDHVIVIIGKIGSSDSVFCDAWAKNKYLWEAHPRELKDYAFYDDLTAELESFDPSFQSVVLKKFPLKNGQQVTIDYDPLNNSTQSSSYLALKSEIERYLP